MSITSLAFPSFALAFIVIFNLIPGARARRALLGVGNAAFLWFVMPDAAAIGCFLLFLLAVWGALAVAAKRSTRLAFAAVLFALIFLFGWLKRYEFLPFLPFWKNIPVIVGLSYVLIRALQLLIDVQEEMAAKPSLFTLFNYLTTWPSLISGPIQRFEAFDVQQRALGDFRLDTQTVDLGLRRIARGYILVLVVGDFVQVQWLNLASYATHQYAPFALAGAQLAFLAYLFLNFSGYTDIAIGLGALIGLRLPENFDRPWMATSFLDFWGRWHMSMSNWFKTYVFTPFSAYLMRRGQLSHTFDIEGVVAFFVTFFLVGLWHGTTLSFVVCGVLLGLGASVNQFYRTALRRRLGKARFNSLCANPVYTVASAVFGLGYVCFSATALWMTFPQMGQTAATLGLFGNAITAVTMLVMLAVLVPIVRQTVLLGRFELLRAPPALLTGAYIGCALFLIEFYHFITPAAGGGIFYSRF
jgi:alginate O-acetyltransferase complex protein AlgI